VILEYRGNYRVDINVFNLKSFLINKEYIRWLTKEAIIAAIILRQNMYKKHVINSYV
jgi:hypothetical protein